MGCVKVAALRMHSNCLMKWLKGDICPNEITYYSAGLCKGKRPERALRLLCSCFLGDNSFTALLLPGSIHPYQIASSLANEVAQRTNSLAFIDSRSQWNVYKYNDGKLALMGNELTKY